MKRFHLLVAVLLFITAFPQGLMAQQASQPNVLDVAGTLGMQEFQKAWIGTIGAFIEMGADQGMQLRLAVSTGLLNTAIFTQLESIFILNFAEKFYAGAGLGVAMALGNPEGGVPLYLAGLVGVKSKVSKDLLVQVEGGITMPITTDTGPGLRGALIAIIPF